MTAVRFLSALENVIELLTTPGSGCELSIQPCRVALYPGGEVAFDSCESSGDLNGQLWANLQPAAVNPNQSQQSPGCQRVHLTGQIGLTRCAAMPRDDGTPPDVADVAANAWQQALDADEISRAINCCLTGDDKDHLSLASWNPIDNQGGCYGGIWTVTGVYDICCPVV